MIELDRRENESEVQYHKRLVFGKLVDKTLQDYDFSEIAQRLYGRVYSSDMARRMMYGSRKTLEAMDDDAVRSVYGEGILAEIEQKTTELRKERQRYYDQRREYGKLVTRDSRTEHLYDVLERSAAQLIDTIGVLYEDIPQRQEHCDNDAVLVLCDWHYGMVADNIFNTYNTDVCIERVKHIVEQTRQRLFLHGCRTLHIVVLGDLFHGAIHTSARVAQEELVCDQIMKVSEILAQQICTLSMCAEHTEVYYTYGNHGRTIQSKGDSIHRDNMERLIPWWLKRRLVDYENIHVNSDDGNEYLCFDVCGHSFVAAHGDQDSVKTQPRTLFPLMREKYGRDIEYILLADKHHRESFEEFGVTAMVCGSLCGTDDYANDKRLFQTPSQLLLVVNEDIGVDAEYVIKA